MFLTDVVDFIIIVFGFWAFGVSMSTVGLSTVVLRPTVVLHCLSHIYSFFSQTVVMTPSD